MKLTPHMLRQLRHPGRITVRCWHCGTKTRRRPREVVEWEWGWPLVSYGRCSARVNDWDDERCGKHLFAPADRRKILIDLFRKERSGAFRASEYDI